VSQTKQPGPEHALGPEAAQNAARAGRPNRRGEPRWPELSARLQNALPLLVVYFLFATLYVWQASGRPVPTIFTDELELTQLSRAISATGEAARRGQPYGQLSLLPYVLAPVWWLGKTTAGYATAKVLLVLMMTAAVFPAYGIARLVVPRWWALAAAATSIAIPAMAYSPIFVREPLAYPLSTISLWLIARLLVRPTWKGAAFAIVACLAAALTRTQLAILFVVLALALLWLAWESRSGRRWRATFGTWDWIGGAVLVVGIAVVFSALVGHFSQSWAITTKQYKGRIFDHATEALGALAIGIGVLPLVLGLAALVRPRGEPRTRETSAFVATSVIALAVFVWYTGIKGAYLSTVFSTIVAERDLIYLAPLLLVGTVLAIHRGVGRWWAIAVAAVVTFYVVLAPPLHLSEYPYYEAHGLEIAAFANRVLGWSEDGIRRGLWIVCVLAVALAIAFKLLRRGSRAFTVVAATVGVLVIAWSLTTEVYAAKGETHLSKQIDKALPKPLNWVDDATGGGSVVVIGQGITDPTGIQETEIFNKSIKHVWSIDGTAIKAGAPVLTPDLQAANGKLYPAPGTRYALALNGVELQAPLVRQVGQSRLYRLPPGPMKLAAAVTGIQSDGWMAAPDANTPATASYTRYAVSHDGPGLAVVTLSRVASCPKQEAPGRVTVKIGPVGVGPDKEPKIARVTAVKRGVVRACSATGFSLSVPDRPWRMEVSVAPTFVPQEVDPVHFSDRRHLGAVVTRIGFQPLFGG